MSHKPAPDVSRIRQCLGSPYVIIVLAGLLCHGILLLCDYKIWDGWLVENWQRTPRYDAMWRQYFEAGIPHHYLVHRLFGLSTNSVWLYKLVSLASYITVACILYSLLLGTGFLKAREALLAAVLMLVFPGMMTLGEAALTPYVLGLLFFSIASWLSVRSEFERGARHAVTRTGAIILFLPGLTYYGLVPFYLVFYLFFLGFVRSRASPCTWGEFASLAARRADYLVVPLVFWWLKGKFAPTSGYWVGYNAPGFNPKQWLVSGGSFFENYFFRHLEQLPLNPLVFATCAAAGWWLSRLWQLPAPESWKRAGVLAAQGIFAVFMGAFPYIVVGRHFNAFGYLSNSNLLLPFGASLVLLAMIGCCRLLTPWDHRGVISNSILIYTLVSCASVWSKNYLHWQALRAKEQSVADKLQADSVANASKVFLVVDRFPIPETDTYPVAMSTTQFQEALGNTSVFAINLRDIGYARARLPRGLLDQLLESTTLPFFLLDQLLESTTLPFFFNALELDGPQALVVISRGEAKGSPVEIGLLDLYYKRVPFASEGDYEKFSASLAEVFVSPIP